MKPTTDLSSNVEDNYTDNMRSKIAIEFPGPPYCHASSIGLDVY